MLQLIFYPSEKENLCVRYIYILIIRKSRNCNINIQYIRMHFYNAMAEDYEIKIYSIKLIIISYIL